MSAVRELPHYHLEPRPNPGLLSIVVPLYNEVPVLHLLRERLEAVTAKLPCAWEIILVNDGSRDKTLELALDWAKASDRVKVVGLARNFGHQAAVTAGLDYVEGDATVVMDADLQDPPEVIFDMLKEYRRGYDVVYGQRTSRAGESVFKRASAWLFYRIMRLLVYRDLPPDVGDFRLISRTCLDALRTMRESHRFLRGMVAWVGFAQTSVKFERPCRAAGVTKYPFHKMLRFAWTAAVSFSPAPLRISLLAGFSLATVGLAYGVYAVMRTLLGLYVVPGWTSMLVVVCLVGGGILVAIGILGEYVARVFEEVKKRPLYLVAVQANLGGREPQLPDLESSNQPEGTQLFAGIQAGPVRAMTPRANRESYEQNKCRSPR